MCYLNFTVVNGAIKDIDESYQYRIGAVPPRESHSNVSVLTRLEDSKQLFCQIFTNSWKWMKRLYARTTQGISWSDKGLLEDQGHTKASANGKPLYIINTKKTRKIILRRNVYVNPLQARVFGVKFSLREIRRIFPIKLWNFKVWKMPKLLNFRFPGGDIF